MTEPSVYALHCPVASPDAHRRLVCLPHAGGSPSLFRDWGHFLPGTEVYAACYPGRASRFTEPPPTDLRQLAHDIAVAVEPLADLPIALFGHSMGAPLALEVARVLEDRGVAVSHLFASGSVDGECVPIEPEVDDPDPDVLADMLVRLGGTDPELARDPDFQDLVMPYVMGDSSMFHAYTMEPEPLLACPVTTIVGDRDPDADRRPWRRLTSGSFVEHVVAGDHFYLMSKPPFDEISLAFAADN